MSWWFESSWRLNRSISRLRKWDPPEPQNRVFGPFEGPIFDPPDRVWFGTILSEGSLLTILGGSRISSNWQKWWKYFLLSRKSRKYFHHSEFKRWNYFLHFKVDGENISSLQIRFDEIIEPPEIENVTPHSDGPKSNSIAMVKNGTFKIPKRVWGSGGSHFLNRETDRFSLRCDSNPIDI